MQRIIYNITILSIAITFFNCTTNEEKSKQNKILKEVTTNSRIFVSKTQFDSSEMTLGKIEERLFPITVKTNGIIDVPPENRAMVSAIMGGYIKKTPLLAGDKVRKGQILVTIENPDFIHVQQEYMEVNEQLTYLKSEFERQKKMAAEKITSQKNFLKAESTYKMAKARYNGLREQLLMLNISVSSVESGIISSEVNIYAPISGIITKVNVSRGTYVSPSTAILEIINNGHIHLELSVFEKHILKLKKGQEINFKIPESSTETFKAEVYLINAQIEDNRTVKVHGHLANESNTNLLTGMFVEAEIVTESTLEKALPEIAITNIEDQHFVLQLDEITTEGYYFVRKEVNTVKNIDKYIEILNPNIFKSDATFLINGAFNLIQ